MLPYLHEESRFDILAAVDFLPERLPRELSLEVTRRCNYHCPYCYCIWHESGVPDAVELSSRDWKAIIDECARKGVRSLSFTGGEALLRRDILVLARYARSVIPDASVSIFTNASLLSDAKIRMCRRANVRLATSLQGIASYGSMTGTNRSYRDLLRVLIRADELKWPMGVSITVTKANRGEALEMLYAALAAGASSVSMYPMMFEGRAIEHPELMLTRREWERVKKRCRRFKTDGRLVTFGDEMVCECNNRSGRVLMRYGIGLKAPCPAGRTFGVVGPDGRFRKCLHTLETTR